MKKFLLWIFLFSFLSCAAQNKLTTRQDSVSNYGNVSHIYTGANSNYFEKIGNINNIINYNNPVDDNFIFTVNLQKQTRLTVEIYSILGIRNIVKHFEIGKGISKFSIDVSSLPRGMYIVRFTDKNRDISLTQKLLKE